MLQDRGVDFTKRDYMRAPLSVEELRALFAKLGRPAGELLRTREAAAKELGLSKDDDDETLFAAMAEHPQLMERPVLVVGARAILGRPAEAVLELV